MLFSQQCFITIPWAKPASGATGPMELGSHIKNLPPNSALLQVLGHTYKSYIVIYSASENLVSCQHRAIMCPSYQNIQRTEEVSETALASYYAFQSKAPLTRISLFLLTHWEESSHKWTKQDWKESLLQSEQQFSSFLWKSRHIPLVATTIQKCSDRPPDCLARATPYSIRDTSQGEALSNVLSSTMGAWRRSPFEAQVPKSSS